MSNTPRTGTVAVGSIASRAAAAAAIAAILMPGAANAQSQGDWSAAGPKERTGYEKRYLEVRKGFVAANGRQAAGRNIVRYGDLDEDGDARTASRARVKASIARMKPPPVPEGVVAETTTQPSTEAPTYSGGAAATSATAQCESGGDYGAVNPAGYYGAYQFDQGTWDAYAPEGYAGVNPATAPPEVQDAAAAAVPYDAWPNC